MLWFCLLPVAKEKKSFWFSSRQPGVGVHLWIRYHLDFDRMKEDFNFNCWIFFHPKAPRIITFLPSRFSVNSLWTISPPVSRFAACPFSPFASASLSIFLFVSLQVNWCCCVVVATFSSIRRCHSTVILNARHWYQHWRPPCVSRRTITVLQMQRYATYSSAEQLRLGAEGNTFYLSPYV